MARRSHPSSSGFCPAPVRDAKEDESFRRAHKWCAKAEVASPCDPEAQASVDAKASRRALHAASWSSSTRPAREQDALGHHQRRLGIDHVSRLQRMMTLSHESTATTARTSIAALRPSSNWGHLPLCSVRREHVREI